MALAPREPAPSWPGINQNSELRTQNSNPTQNRTGPACNARIRPERLFQGPTASAGGTKSHKLGMLVPVGSAEPRSHLLRKSLEEKPGEAGAPGSTSMHPMISAKSLMGFLAGIPSWINPGSKHISFLTSPVSQCPLLPLVLTPW